MLVVLAWAAAAAMFDPWWLLFLLMVFVVGVGAVRSDSLSVRYVYLNSMCLGWWCCIQFWVLLLPRRWISVSRQRSSSSSSPVWTSPMVFHRIHVRRSELRRTVSCGTSMGWGLLVGWEQVFSLCFRRSLLLASSGGGRIQSCRRRRRRRRTGDSSCGPGCNLLLLQAALCKFWDVILLIYKPTRFAKKDPCRSNWLQELYIF